MSSRIATRSDLLQITALDKLPLLKKGDDLASMIVVRAKALRVGIRTHDVLVIGQKAVSKAEGRIVNVDGVKPSTRAIQLAKTTGKRPELVEIILKESSKVLRADGDALIVTTRKGATCLNAGVDKSNVKGDSDYALLPENPDRSAKKLMRRIQKLTGRDVGVVITDTRSRPFRRGQVEECIGIAGLNPIVDYRGQKDLFGYTLRFKNVALADELASAAELVMGQGREATPVALIRGLTRVVFRERATSKSLAVSPAEDLFRGTL
jgi:coenzyme F420-0:L-glutamate ligase / coenzyme F420-1:gamma-L-glutamate ligase